MPKVVYPTENKYDGPWLIEYGKLAQLDAVAEKKYQELLQIREKQITEAVRIEIKTRPDYKKYTSKAAISRLVRERYEFQGESRSVAILLPKERKVVAESFEAARKEKLLDDVVPLGFELQFEVARTSATISLGGYDRNTLNYRVRSSDDSLAADITYEIESWIKSVRPPAWHRFWKMIHGWHFLLLFLLFPIFLVATSIPSNTYKRHLRVEALQLVRQGITVENQPRATQLLLELAIDMPPKTSFDALPWRALAIISLTIVGLVFVASFPPRSHVGIGKGENRIKFWRIYLQILSVTIPVGVILPTLLNQIRLF